MKLFCKKYWYIMLLAMLINIPLIVFGTVRTNKTITLKGDTTIVENFVEVENAYSQAGSFSTIYVISMDHSTLLQNFMLDGDTTSEVGDIYEGYLHLSNRELNLMSSIQHQTSIINSLIIAYKNAKKVDSSVNLNAVLTACRVSYYPAGSEFRIDDRIVGVNGIYANDNLEQFVESFNARKEGDIFNVLRNDEAIEIEYSKSNLFAFYPYYSINQETVSPKYTIKPTTVGGPSGGFLQTLALYNSLIEEDITRGRKIAGTGTMELDGTIGKIGGIQQKIFTAYDDEIEVFLCPKDNYEEALIAYNKLPNKNKMKLYSIESFEQGLEVLAYE